MDNSSALISSTTNQEGAKQSVSTLLLEFLTQPQNKKLKVKHLADRIGIDRTTMSRIVHGHLLPSPPICQALAQIMGIADQQLLKLAGYISSSDPLQDDLMLEDPELALQFYQVGSLLPQDKEFIKNFLRAEIQKAQTRQEPSGSNRPPFARPIAGKQLPPYSDQHTTNLSDMVQLDLDQPPFHSEVMIEKAQEKKERS